MSIPIESIAEAAAQAYSAKSVEARNASSISEALDMQEEGFKSAIKILLEKLLETAVIVGGTCTPNGPIAGAKIT